MAIPDCQTLPVLQSGAADAFFVLILLVVGIPLLFGYLLKLSSQGECHICGRKFTVASYPLVCFGRHKLHAQCAVRRKRQKSKPVSKPVQPPLPGMPPPEAPGTTRLFPTRLQIGDKFRDESGEWEVRAGRAERAL
jgi:hypothetical protein